MKFEIELNAKCRNCTKWVFETEIGIDFLNEDETYCFMVGKKVKENDECEHLEIDLSTLKDNLKSAGYKSVKVIK